MAAYKYKYALNTAPFHFLGHFSVSQKTAFKAWTAARTGNFPDIQTFHQIRAQQLRKTAGLLEEFYKNYNDQQMVPSFTKDAWKPGTSGHFQPHIENDHLPMVTMSKIKDRFKEQLQRDEEGMFIMNHVRCLIEKHEDAAQYAKEVSDPANTNNLKALLAQIDTYFGQVEYESCLVNDTITYANSGQPYFRVNPFDTPTQWELEQMNHGTPGQPIQLKQGSDE